MKILTNKMVVALGEVSSPAASLPLAGRVTVQRPPRKAAPRAPARKGPR